MKKILYSIIVGSSLLTSCTKLDEDPLSNISTDSFYKTQSDAVASVQAVYNSLTHNNVGDHASIYNRQLVLSAGMSSDDHVPGPRATNPDVRSMAVLSQSETNTRYAELWRQHYDGINRANAAIDRIPAIAADTTVTHRLVREAKFLRALFYFNLVRLWGDVPLLVHENTSLTDLNVPRTPANEVYNQIISDLTDATLLPTRYSGADGFRATSGAAHAILLDVYITRKEWQKALDAYTEVSNAKYGYYLFPNYADNFSVAKENSGEHIFDANYIADGSGAGFNGTGNTNILGHISLPVSINGQDADAPHPSLYALFSATDKRRDVTFVHDSILSPIDGKYKPLATPKFRKYWDLSAGKNYINSGINAPIIRYAEVVLFFAEAENELNGPTTAAYTAINQIRSRAGLPDLTAGLSQDQFRDAVYLERRLEFVYEQIRWFDLIRTKRLVSELSKLADKKNVSEKNYLFPIPTSERLLNPNLTQNPGWN